MSLAEFLRWDDGTDRRYELVRGRLVAMAPPSVAHATIVPNLIGALRPNLKRSIISPQRSGLRWRIGPTRTIRQMLQSAARQHQRLSSASSIRS
jgi:Uma2 family endonuclease